MLVFEAFIHARRHGFDLAHEVAVVLDHDESDGPFAFVVRQALEALDQFLCGHDYSKYDEMSWAFGFLPSTIVRASLTPLAATG